MTDARLPERWLNARKFRRLSDREWRSYTHALMWSVANRTDGVIEHRDIEDIPGFDPSCVPPFVDAGLWSRIDEGWLIVDYLSTQSSRAQLERDDLNRQRNRERQRRHRAKPETTDSGHVTRDITRDHAGQDRTGQDRKYLGQAEKNENGENENADTNGDAERFTPTADQLARIKANVDRGYES